MSSCQERGEERNWRGEKDEGQCASDRGASISESSIHCFRVRQIWPFFLPDSTVT